MDAEIPSPGVTAAEAEHVARVLRATLMIFAQGMAGAPSHWARSALALELDDARGRLAGYERFAMLRHLSIGANLGATLVSAPFVALGITFMPHVKYTF